MESYWGNVSEIPKFWREINFYKALHVGWDAFIAAIKKKFSCSGEQERQLQKILGRFYLRNTPDQDKKVLKNS